MLKAFTIFLFTIMGWKQKGQIPGDIKKCVLVAAPHTSNFDFLLAMAAFYKMKLPVKYLIKREWINFFILRKIFINSGALGINRTKANTMVDTLAELITSSQENLAVMISPEGTRKLVHKWKTGFYYTALKAKVPIVLSHLDYKNKIAAIGPSFMPSGCYRRDMQILKEYYKDKTPKYPDNFSLIIYLVDDSAICAS